MSFPLNPTNSQTTVINGATYSYNSTTNAWTKLPGTITSTYSLLVTAPIQSTATNSGALIVVGGVGIGESVTIGGNLTVNGVINADLSGSGTISTASNLVGGYAGTIPIQSAPGVTAFINAGTTGTLLQSYGNTASWINTSTLVVGYAQFANTAVYALSFNTNTLITTAVNINGGSTGSINYQIAPGQTGFIGIGSTGSFLISNGTTATYGNSIPSLSVTNTTQSTGTNSGALTVAGGMGISQNLYVGVVGYINNAQIVTTATMGGFGITSLTAGTDTAVSTSTGNVTVWNTANLQSITSRGATTNQAINITNNTSGISTDSSQALLVAGGVGIGGTVSIGKAGYINNAIIITTATIGQYSVGPITAGTDTAVSTSTGDTIIWDTSTLQSVTGRGNSTTNTINITNLTTATSTNTGALTVAGGLGVGGNLYATSVYDSGTRVISTIVSGTGISVSNSNGPSVTISNTGVLSLTAGTDTNISTSTGNITVWDSSTLQSVTNRGNTTNNVISIINPTQGTNYSSGQALLVTGGVGIGGPVYINTTSYIAGSQIITTATVNLYATKTTLTAGTDTAVNTSTGNITVWDISTLQSVTGRGSSTTNAIFINNSTVGTSATSGQALLVAGGVGIGNSLYIGTAGYINNAPIITTATIGSYANLTIITAGTDTAVSTGTGNITIWNTSTLQSITGRGNSTNNTISITNTTQSTGTTTGALTVLGGVGVGGPVYINTTSYIAGSQIITSATINLYANQAVIAAGTDTAVNTSTGNITIWNTSTLQSITNRGNSTTNTINLTNNSISNSTSSGALVVAGGVGIGGSVYAGGTLSASGIYDNSNRVYSSITAGVGLGQSAGVGPSVTLTNTGVLTLLAGTDTAVNAITGDITVWSISTLQSVTNRGNSTTNVINLYSSVNSTATTTGALVVAGGIGVGAGITVGGQINIISTITSYSTASGGLVVAGGAGVGGSVNVGGSLSVVNSLTVYSTASSYSSTSGAVIVGGGVGVRESVNIGSSLTVAISAVVSGYSNSTSTTTGALIVNGGVGVGGSLNVGGSLTVGGNIIGNVSGASTSATNLTGGAGGSIPYQITTGTTGFIGIGSIGTILQSNGSSATWASLTVPAATPSVVGGVYANTTGTGLNVALGFNSLGNNPLSGGACSSVAVGYNAMYCSVGGSYNTAIGTKALYYNNTGGFNTAVGACSLYCNYTGNFNTAIGFCTLYSNTAGYGNTALGYGSLYSNTTGANNTALGAEGLSLNTSGNSNLAIGVSALYFNTVGSNNIAIGMRTLICNTTGFNNLAIGNYALYCACGTNNIAVGYQAGCSITSGQSNVVIGSYTGLGIAQSNCNLVLADGTGTIKMAFTATGALSIGNSLTNFGTVGQALISGGPTSAPYWGSLPVTAGTDTAVSTNSGVVTVWNTSTLQTITSRGNSTNVALTITNTTSATNTISGALVVNGGAGIGGSVYIGGNLNVAGTINATLSGTVTTATNIAGGTTGQIPYQSNTGTTAFFGPGTAGQILVSGGAAIPLYVSTGNIYVGYAVNANTSTYAATAYSLANTGSTYVGYALYANTATTATYALTATFAAVAYSLANTGSTYVGYALYANTATTATYAATAYSLANTGSTYVGNALYAGTATNIAGGVVGQLHYQTSTGTTGFVSTGLIGQILVSGGAAVPTYQSTLTLAGTTAASSTITGALIVAGGVGVGGTLYATNVYSNGSPVITTASFGTYGVSSLTAGTDTAVSGATGAVTVWDISTLQSVTNRGNNTTQRITISNTLTSTSSYSANALYVAGGIGGGNGFNILGNGYLTGSLFVTGIISATNITLNTLIASSGTFYGDATGAGALYAGVAGFTGFPQTMIQAGGNYNNYMEINAQNINPGNQASTDIVASADDVTFSSGYIDMGITSSGWDGTQPLSLGTALTPNDGYIMVGQNTTPGNGDLVFGTTTDRTNMKFVVAATGTVTTASIALTINPVNSNASSTISGVLVVYGGAGIGQNLYVGGNLNVAGTINANLSGTVTTATNIAGGTTGQIPYQSNTGTTAFFGPGTAGQILVSGGAAIPLYVSTGNIYVGNALYASTATNIAGGTAGQLHYQSSTGTTAFAGPGTTGQILVSGGTGAPTYQSTLTLAGATSATSTTTGALIVVGGMGIGGAIYVNTTSYIAGSQIITAATINSYANQTTLTAGTDTAISTSTGNITIWNTSTLQTITNRGNSTTNAIVISNITSATSTTTGALVVTGGVGISGGMYVGGITTVTNTSFSSNYNNGALIVAGGIGAGNIFSNGTITANSGIYSSILNAPGFLLNSNSPYYGQIGNTGSTGLWALGFGAAYGNWGTTVLTWSSGSVVTVVSTLSSVSTNTGALQVVGGVGIGGNINAGSYITVQDGFYSISTFTGSYSDGIVVDYVNGAVGNGRISVGPQDSITFYNGGPATTATMQISSTGTVSIPSSNTSINTGTGALVVAGGAGISGNLNVGGQITGTNLIITNTASSTSSFTGQAIQVAGGVGVAGTVYAQNIVVANNGTLTLFRNSGQYFIFEDDDNTTLGYFRSYTSPNNAKTLNFDVRTDAQGSTATSGALGYNFNINGQGALNIAWNNATNSIIGTTINGVSSTSSNSGALVVNGGLGVLGNIYQSGIHVIQNSYQAVSTTSGALQVVNGGAGIGGNVYIGGNLNVSGTISASLSGTVTTATNLSGGTAGQIPYQSSTGTTSFFGPGTVGQVLVSGGTGAPTYQSTLTLAGTTNATSTTTGALIVAGGIGIGGGAYIQGNVGIGNTGTGPALSALTVGPTNGTAGKLLTVSDHANPTSSAGANGILVDMANGGGIYMTQQGSVNAKYEAYNNALGIGTMSAHPVYITANNQSAINISSSTLAVTIYSGANASNTYTGALVVAGGVGVGGAVYIGTNSYIANALILTTATVNQYATQTTITAGTDTAVSTSTGAVTIWNISTLQSITNRGATTNNAVIITNATASTSTNSGALTVAGGVGVGGRIIGGSDIYLGDGTGAQNGSSLFWNGSYPTYIQGMSGISGYLRLSAGNSGITGLGIEAGSGYTHIDFTTPASSTNSGALRVAGGVGIGGAVYINTTSYIANAQIITTATVNLYANQTTITAGTDTAVSTSTGNVTIWNTSNLQTITNRGASTNNVVSITNTTSATSTASGALTVSGGIAVGNSVYVGNRVGFVNTSNVSAVYQFYNPATNSLDTVFG